MSLIKDLGLKWKLVLIAAAALSGLALVAGIGLHAVSSLHVALQSLVDGGALLRNHMEADMLHDAIRGDAVRIAYADNRQDAREAIEELRVHAKRFRQLDQTNESLPLSEAEKQSLHTSSPHVAAYLNAAELFATLAERDPSKLKAALPEIQVRFAALEAPMEVTSKVIEGSSKQAEAGAETLVSQSVWQILAVGGVALLVVLTLVQMVSAALSTPLQNAASVLFALAHGDLSKTLEIDQKDEILPAA